MQQSYRLTTRPRAIRISIKAPRRNLSLILTASSERKQPRGKSGFRNVGRAPALPDFLRKLGTPSRNQAASHIGRRQENCCPPVAWSCMPYDPDFLFPIREKRLARIWEIFESSDCRNNRSSSSTVRAHRQRSEALKSFFCEGQYVSVSVSHLHPSVSIHCKIYCQHHQRIGFARFLRGSQRTDRTGPVSRIDSRHCHGP